MTFLVDFNFAINIKLIMSSIKISIPMMNSILLILIPSSIKLIFCTIVKKLKISSSCSHPLKNWKIIILSIMTNSKDKSKFYVNEGMEVLINIMRLRILFKGSKSQINVVSLYLQISIIEELGVVICIWLKKCKLNQTKNRMIWMTTIILRVLLIGTKDMPVMLAWNHWISQF